MMKRYMTQWHHHHYTNIEIVFNEQYVDWDSAIRNKKGRVIQAVELESKGENAVGIPSNGK